MNVKFYCECGLEYDSNEHWFHSILCKQHSICYTFAKWNDSNENIQFIRCRINDKYSLVYNSSYQRIELQKYLNFKFYNGFFFEEEIKCNKEFDCVNNTDEIILFLKKCLDNLEFL